jgi:Ca2+-binding RTX toxin-like protein
MPNVFYGTNDDDTVLAFEGFQFIYGLGGDDNLTSTNEAIYCEILGGDGNDTLALSPGLPRGLIDGGAGNDVIFGSVNADYLYGGSGNDTIEGGGINDFVDGGSGNDNITAHGIIFGGSGNDTINAPDSDNVIDRIDCGAGNDNCNAGDGNDRVIGGAGNDSLNGGDGADILVGGSGSDVLNGHDLDAVDIFRFTSVKDSLPGANKRDTIVFEPLDIVDLSRIDANTSKTGDQKFIFIGDDPFSGKRGQLHVTGTDSDSILSGDVNGDRKADFQIHVIDAAVLLGNLVL